ncbi:CocE/NonD family hydrolase [Tahibacter soli]|uniref:CocE/NonD family hydrolase n=1 Tax=Tahibacter soli TaxID=2983605 RepID=A0A9X4BGD7_9GAMM|nr:CocE/NonD family hydrolase [Tahibacter soli]MDC8012645.1 CocE/NonD family hydrolase [Tahibacter soli]
MPTFVRFACLLLLFIAPAHAATFDLAPGALADDAAIDRALPALARDVLKTYAGPDRETDLDARFRLQLVAGDYAAAEASLAKLHALTARRAPPQSLATNVQYAIYARAMQAPNAATAFDVAHAAAFRATFAKLDDRTSALVARALDLDRSFLRQSLDGAVAAAKEKPKLELADALALVKAYQIERVYARIGPASVPLVAEDDARRYVIERDVAIASSDGTPLCALVVRPRGAKARLPALLNFTIYTDGNMFTEARRTASNGYAAVEGMTRGKGCSTAQAVPYEHDGRDAAAVIDWIAVQPWSDGRVGMYGGSYEGFTQWAAAKRMPKALKALMPSVTAAPGIDVPKEGGVFFSFVYYWPFYVTNNRTLDNAPYTDRARWNRMAAQWYTSGRAYRDLEKIDGTPNPTFARWLDHPDYDAYWQSMIPYRDDFARIDIPVLTTTGYYDDAQIGALYYLTQHYRYKPDARHYLVIGPYDHIRGQRGTVSRLGEPLKDLWGYKTDAVAQLDIGALRYQWFDHVFRGGPKPSILKDRINYQVMGANTWRHAPSLAAMSKERLRLHLSTADDGTLKLAAKAPAADAKPATLRVDLADRGDIDREPAGRGGVTDTAIDAANGLVFESEPFAQPVELSGLFAGHLAFTTNKRDFDVTVRLYERSASGEYFQLSRYITRASYADDLTRRALLAPGEKQAIDFTSGRLTSRRFAPGSRLVALVQVNKIAMMQINMGSGKDVSDETGADGGEPLNIDWHGDSWLEVPLTRGR